MKTNILTGTLMLMLLLASFCTYGYADTESTGNDETEEKEKESWGFAGYPIPFYSPETKIGLGAGFVLYHNPDPVNDSLRPDELEFTGIGTQKKQIEANLSGKIFFSGNDFLLSGKFKMRNWPDEFCGIGPDTSEKDMEKFTDRSYTAEANFMYQIFTDIFIGPAFLVADHRIMDREQGGALIGDTIAGSDGAFVTAAGVKVAIDRADSPIYPAKGFTSEIRILSYNKYTGSDFSFSQYELDHRQYFQVVPGHIIALQGWAIFSQGDVPFQSMQQIGGMTMLRGYKQDLYRDRQYMAVQAEYRFPIWWRLGGAVFAAAGEVAHCPCDFNIRNIRSTYGGGLRLLLDKKEHINLRLDFGVTDQLDGNVYLSLLEAF